MKRLLRIEQAKAKERQDLGLKSDEGARSDEPTAKQFGIGKDTMRKEIHIVDNQDLLDPAEQRIGELLLEIPKASGNQYTSANSTRTEKAKSEIVSEMGYSKDEASDYQQMAKHPEVVQKVIEEALANCF